MEPHCKYIPHLEHGLIVWYRTTRSVVTSRNMTTGVEQRSGTHIDRVPTNTSDYEEACKQLDRRLSKPKGDPQVKAGPNQLKLL